jgi:hypothetical protein
LFEIYAMITSTSILFSAASVRRVLGLASGAAVSFRVWAYVIWVHVPGSRPTFISKRRFYSHFAEYRQAAGQQIRASGKVSKVSDTRYTVDSNSAESGFHMVELHPDRVACECHDYSNQVEFFGRGVCKHGYAAIGQLGLTTLAEYLKAAEQAQRMIAARQARPLFVSRHHASAMAG